MIRNINELSENEKKFLKILLSRGNICDSEISKTTGLSKATVGRIRKNLERNLITEYLPVIELDKAGIEVFATLLFEWKGFPDKELTKKVFSRLSKDPNTIFMANGQGSESLSTVLFLGFTGIAEYHNYFKSFREEYGDSVGKVVTLILPSKEIVKQDFTDLIKKQLGEKNE